MPLKMAIRKGLRISLRLFFIGQSLIGVLIPQSVVTKSALFVIEKLSGAFKVRSLIQKGFVLASILAFRMQVFEYSFRIM
jgi:hypothetical protein